MTTIYNKKLHDGTVEKRMVFLFPRKQMHKLFRKSGVYYYIGINRTDITQACLIY